MLRLRLLLSLLLLYVASTWAATTPGSFAGAWGGEWNACIWGGLPIGCPNVRGKWTGIIDDRGHFMGTMENCGPYGVCTMVGNVDAKGVLNLGQANYVACRQTLVVQLGLNPRSVGGDLSCEVKDCFIVLCATTHYMLTFAGGEASLQSGGNYQGLWWNSPAGSESGWGIHVAQQGETLFATWFSYGQNGNGMWLVMPNGVKVADGAYSGTLYRSTGPAFDAQPWSQAQVHLTAVGAATFMFENAEEGTFIYSLDDSAEFPWPYGSRVWFQAKPITRLVFSSPVPTCEAGGASGASPNYGDLWWNSPAGSESGWGVNVAHQGDILFATWFTYDSTHKGVWLVMSNGIRTGPNTYAGALHRTSGSPYSYRWDPAKATQTQVGTATFTFDDANNGVFSYVVNGIAQSKPITRLSFGAPATVCH